MCRILASASLLVHRRALPRLKPHVSYLGNFGNIRYIHPEDIFCTYLVYPPILPWTFQVVNLPLLSLYPEIPRGDLEFSAVAGHQFS